MYAWLWRTLPGNAALKSLQAALLVALVVFGLFSWVFPALTPLVDNP